MSRRIHWMLNERVYDGHEHRRSLTRSGDVEIVLDERLRGIRRWDELIVIVVEVSVGCGVHRVPFRSTLVHVSLMGTCVWTRHRRRTGLL